MGCCRGCKDLNFFSKRCCRWLKYQTKSVVGVAHIFTKKCGRCKKLSLGVSLVPVNFGVPPLGKECTDLVE